MTIYRFTHPVSGCIATGNAIEVLFSAHVEYDEMGSTTATLIVHVPPDYSETFKALAKLHNWNLLAYRQ
jgi:hypothetical protein